eukprot:3935242-Rhodomonas_salina.2
MAIGLNPPYAMPGARLWCYQDRSADTQYSEQLTEAMLLRPRYAACGTDVGYAATRRLQLRVTLTSTSPPCTAPRHPAIKHEAKGPSVCATRCLILTQRIRYDVPPSKPQYTYPGHGELSDYPPPADPYQVTYAVGLRARCAMSGTDIAYGRRRRKELRR